MSHSKPENTRELLSFLIKLGFKEKKRVGKGHHQYKLYHPSRNYIGDDYRNFIIVPSKVYNQIVSQTIKRLVCWGFTPEEIEDAF